MPFYCSFQKCYYRSIFRRKLDEAVDNICQNKIQQSTTDWKDGVKVFFYRINKK